MPVEKRKVTMTSVVMTPEGVGTHEAIDYVPVDIVDAYADHERGRWQTVTVGDEHDPGPGGDGGLTCYPGHLPHPLAGLAIDSDGNEVPDVEAWHAARAAASKRKAR